MKATITLKYTSKKRALLEGRHTSKQDRNIQRQTAGYKRFGIFEMSRYVPQGNQKRSEGVKFSQKSTVEVALFVICMCLSVSLRGHGSVHKVRFQFLYKALEAIELTVARHVNTPCRLQISR